MSGFIQVWRKRDGASQVIPRHWLDIPELGEPFTTERPAVVVSDCCGGGGEDDEEPTPTTTTTTAGRAKRPRK